VTRSKNEYKYVIFVLRIHVKEKKTTTKQESGEKIK